MALVDELKDRAGRFATEARKLAAQAQTRVDVLQLRRRADHEAKELGYLVYRQRTGKEPADDQKVATRVEAIAELERRIAEAEQRLRGETAGGTAAGAETEASR